MNLHEFQAKALLQDYGLPLPAGAMAATAAEAVTAARGIGAGPWVVKAQIHAGGRGKAGGVISAASLAEVEQAAARLLGSRLATAQTGADGRLVKQVYVESACAIAREIYLAVLVDRSAGKVALMASAAGGAEIEAESAADPQSVHRVFAAGSGALDPDELQALTGHLGLAGEAADQTVRIAQTLSKAFVDCDASLIEVNPLAVTDDGEVVAVDVKMILDDNALFRHPKFEALRDQDEEDPVELEAKRYELNFVNLEGDIGCVVNGAGLALATLDLLKEYGGAPANFMDIRPVATRDQVATGFEMILANPRLKAILVNIYGGGVLRCDTIAEGIALACSRTPLAVPLIVRAAGTNMEICRKILTGQRIAAQFADDMGSAAALAVDASKREAA